LEGYLYALSAAGLEPNKVKAFTSLASPQVYGNVADLENYDSANETLKELYVKPGPQPWGGATGQFSPPLKFQKRFESAKNLFSY